MYLKSLKNKTKIFVCCACTTIVVSLSAQDDIDLDSSEAFELDPFVVQATIGYLATTQISGTRVNVAIKDTPIALEVLTAELLEDQGATGFKDSLAYSSGIFTDSALDTASGANPSNGDRSPSSSAKVGDPRNNAITIRGFNAPFQQRMGFRLGTYIGVRGDSSGQGSTGRGGITLGGVIDTVNVDRIEIVRGPGALLYGLGVISGIANIIPKEPLSEFRTNLQFGVGSNDYLRGALDTTGPVLKRDDGSSLLDYRVMSSYQETGNWTDYYLTTQKYYAAQLKWYPIKGMSILGEFQGGNTHIDGIGNQYIYDSINYWRDDSERPFRNEFGELYRWGFEDWSGPDPDIWDTSKWTELWDADNQPTHPLAATFKPLEGPFLSPSARVTGPDTYFDREEWSGILRMNWVVNDNLAITLGGYHTEQDIEELNVVARTFINGQNGVSVDPNSKGYDPAYEGYGFGMLNPVFLSSNPNDQVIYRGIGYYWTNLPTKAESTQIQADVRYQFETEFLHANHSFLLGRQEVKDEADLPLGTVPFGAGEVQDAFRTVSFYDWQNPLRYQGENLVSAGSQYFTTKLWYQGSYLVYHGRFFDDKFAVIGGMRRDRFEGYEERWARLDNSNEKDFTRLSLSDDYGAIADIPGIEKAYYNFDKASTVDTGSIGLTYSITDSLNIYAVMAQGVIPNTGVRDGAGVSIKPEETLSKEIGLKFDFFDGRISGTVSMFQIDRENAIWDYSNAPAPGKWEGGRNPFIGNDLKLNVENLIDGAPRSYAVSYELYFRDLVENDVGNWRERLGIRTNPRTGTLSDPNSDPKIENGQIVDFPAISADQPYSGILHLTGSPTAKPDAIVDDNRPYVYIDYEYLSNDEELRAIMEQAFDDYSKGNHPGTIAPINYLAPRKDSVVGNNASANSGGAVTFEERAQGIDGQIIYSPLETNNLQIIFNFAHIEREATSNFSLNPAIDYLHPELGNLGTEYDVWVKDLGRENFEDPTDPTTLKGGIQGKSLYYGAEDSASIWAKYTFITGPFKNLEIGLGARYTGTMQTSIPIGSGDLADNRYQTPKTEPYTQFDAAIIYTKKFDSFDLRLRLNLYNLTDKNTLYTVTSYQNVDYPDLTETRRTLRYLEPFRIRFSAELKF